MPSCYEREWLKIESNVQKKICGWEGKENNNMEANSFVGFEMKAPPQVSNKFVVINSISDFQFMGINFIFFFCQKLR